MSIWHETLKKFKIYEKLEGKEGESKVIINSWPHGNILKWSDKKN